MKKLLKIFVTLLFVVSLCGCGTNSEEKNASSANEDEKTIKCTISQNDLTNGYKLESEYSIYAKGDVVNSVKTKETVISDQESILSYFETTLNTTYEKYNSEYGGYTYEVIKDTNSVTSNVEIDYSKMDLNKFSKDQSSIRSAMNDNNELTVDGMKAMYESIGATCE